MEHINLEVNGKVYCHLLKDVVKFDKALMKHHCEDCPFFAGDGMGEGVICDWEDKRNVKEPYIVDNPNKEALEVNSGDEDES